MILLLIALLALTAILLALGYTIVADGYDLRPPPRSHRAEVEYDSWGLPIRFVRPRQ